MKKYRGYYIDKVMFSCEADIDQFLKEQAIEAYKIAVELFAKRHSIESSEYACQKADILHSEFNLGWDEIEQIEINTLEAMA